MMPPGLAAGGPSFPVATARDLIAKLRRAASDLETAATDRTAAGERLTEFEGVFADQYRHGLGSYATRTTDACEMLRRTAGLLDDAIDEHAQRRQTWFDMGQPV